MVDGGTFRSLPIEDERSHYDDIRLITPQNGHPSSFEIEIPVEGPKG